MNAMNAATVAAAGIRRHRDCPEPPAVVRILDLLGTAWWRLLRAAADRRDHIKEALYCGNQPRPADNKQAINIGAQP